MKRVFYLVVLLGVAAIFYVYAYPRLAGQNDVAGAAPPAGARGGFATSVVVAVAQKQTVPITHTAVGFIEPINSVVIRPRADGTVIEQDVKAGQMVKAGAVLFKLDDSAITATIAKDQAMIAKDQANADSAQATLSREQDLVKKQVVPQSTLDVDIAAAKTAAAQVAVDQAQLKADQVALGYMTITAPISGRVGTVNTSVGNVVKAADTSAGGLLTITQMSPLRVSFTVPESELDSFRAALATQKYVPVAISAPGDATARATGKLDFIDSSVDTSSGTVVLKADVDNSAGKLWPGQYVSTVTQVGAYVDATTIPLVAVQESDTGPFVFAVGNNEKVSKVPVTVIASINDTAVVGAPIKPGEHVVVEGQMRLSQGSAVKETLVGSTGAPAGAPGSQGAGAQTSKGSRATRPASGNS